MKKTKYFDSFCFTIDFSYTHLVKNLISIIEKNMKTPLSWISLYSPLSPLLEKNTLKSLAHEYSIHTAEIDGIEDHFIDKVVIGKVISCEKHTESKKLSIVEVLVWNGEKTTILTGAANIALATYVPVAVVGAILPWDFVIWERMMAGMLSRGMICSDDELGLATERAEWIMILEEHWDTNLLESMIGQSFFDLTLPFPGHTEKEYRFPLRDATFEIDNKFITNRPDLFSVYGNAREWHTVFGVPFAEYNSKSVDTILSGVENTFSLKIETERCFAYNAWKMEDITIGKSPWGVSLMMERAGLAPKMDIVDITNCIMTELGQPMHAFDADKIVWWITVRMAKVGEKLLALNGSEYILTSDDMVIADARWPVALAWVIGGMESAVSESTTSIIWESACFDPISVRLSSQRHGLRTDASTRYEKSLDPLLTRTVLPRVLEYMRFMGKTGEISAFAEYLSKEKVNHTQIDVSYEFLSTKIWITIPETEIKRILLNLGFIIKNEEPWILTIEVPSWRATKDINIREDIAEEVWRVYGYDNVPLIPLTANFSISQKNADKVLRDKTLSYFSHRWWSEVYNYSFSNQELDKKLSLGSADDAVAIKNAFNVDYTHMRRSLAGRLLENIRDNSRHNESLRFFEIWNIYSRNGQRNALVEEFLKDIDTTPFSERKMIAWVMQSSSIDTLRQEIEGYLENVLGFIPPLFQDNGAILPFLHPGISGSYMIGDDAIVRFWQVHPETIESYEIPLWVFYFEIEFTSLLNLVNESDRVFHPLSRFQTIRRELNFVMDERTRTGDVANHINATHPWIQNITVDSIFRDEVKVWVGKKSVNFAFSLVNTENTISDNDALEVQNNIIATMEKLWYNLRTL
jgi:phenylalanyl-tRNA synthetase beta chain